MSTDEAFLLLFAMVTGIECALLYLGLHALLNGKLPAYTEATCVVQVRPARLIGACALHPTSITLAVVGAVVGEFVGGEAGLGYMLMVANGSMDMPLLFAGLIALTVQGVVLYALVEWAEYLAIPRRSTAATAALQAVAG